MKKYVFASLLMCGTSFAFSQTSDDKLNVQNLSIPSTPGFSLLDVAPASIDKPSNPKALGLSVLSVAGNGAGLPKNFAFELCPYWMMKHNNETPFKYFGVRQDGLKRASITSGFLRKMTVSIVSVYNDSASNLPSNTNFISVGLRTNLLTIRTTKQTTDIKEAMSEQAKQLGVLNAKFKTTDDRNAYFQQFADAAKSTTDADGLQYAKVQKNMNNLLAQHPLVQVDGAGAYAQGFQSNNYENGKFFRSAAWINAAIYVPLTTDETSQKSYLNVMFMYKGLQQNVLSDTVHTIYKTVSANDIGVRMEFELNNLTASFEYVNRTYAKETTLNGARRVGMIQYKVNDKLAIYGTYGENFGGGNNLIALFGINFGVGQTTLDLFHNS